MEESNIKTHQFSGFRGLIWPIHRFELKKLLPMLVLFFFVSLNYNILRTLKDTLVIVAGKSSGAEVIPAIKLWGILPGAVLITLLYTRLANRFSRETVFYVIISFFLLYFVSFIFLLYPNRDLLHPYAFCESMQEILPAGFNGLITMCRNWTFTLFYIMSELWGTTVLFLLMWGFANQIVKVSEAKRFYALFGVGANASGMVAGQLSVYLCKGTLSWEQSVVSLISIVIVSGLVILMLFYLLTTKVLTDPRYCDPNETKKQDEVRGKLSLKQSFAHLLQSRYLIYLTIIVISYNVIINLVEIIWKDQMRAQFPNPTDFHRFYNQVSSFIGMVATLAALFISGNSLRILGWTFTALLTPIVLLITSIAFFGVYFMKDNLHGFALAALGVSPLMLIVLIGAMQNILARGAKYTVFDITKEMAFVPLGITSKLKGQAAIDGVCNRFGKSGGSMIHQSLLFVFATFSASSPYVFSILLLIISVWMISVWLLGKEFNLLVSNTEQEDKEEIRDIPEFAEQQVV